jgi:hypothetical protein
MKSSTDKQEFEGDDVKPEFEEVKKRVQMALQAFIKDNAYLIKHDVNERTITAKFAEYLQDEFIEFNVDCEYNRNVDNPDNNFKKKLEQIEAAYNKEEKSSTITRYWDTGAKTVYPDIIIHRRGTNTSNLLVIEAKKSGNSTEIDLEKLNVFTKGKLSYHFGLSLELICGTDDGYWTNLIWFKKDTNEVNNFKKDPFIVKAKE